MARQCKDGDFQPGKYVHYWGQLRRILRVYKNFVILSDDHSFTGEIQVEKDNEFLLTFEPLDEQGTIDSIYG